MEALLNRNARCLALLAILIAGTGTSSSAVSAATPRVSAVGYTSAAALDAAVARAHATVVRRLPALHVALLRTSAPLRALDDIHGIRYAEAPVPRYQLREPALAPAPVPGGAYEWQFAATHEDLVPPSVAAAAAKVTVAVIDSGADMTAPDIAAKTPKTWSLASDDLDPEDSMGHGTFVSSLAAGATANGEGVAGFGGDAKLLVVKAGGAVITSADVASCIVYAVDHGADIINMSFGGPDQSAAERDAIAYAADRGVVLVGAVGNDGQGANTPVYPAAYLQPLGSNGSGGVGLSVAATDVGSARAPFSTYGSYISLAAPGLDVFGALSAASDPADWPRVALPGSTAGVYGYASGTSFAAPQVAGAAALVWAANPLLTADDVAAVLKGTASNNGSWDQYVGYGIIDVAAAVARAKSIPVPPPSVQLRGTVAGRRVRLSWTSSNAASFRLDVSRDHGPAQVLLGASSAKSTSTLLAPGHTYSFTVVATTRFGLSYASQPYVVTLPLARVRVGLRVSSFTVGGHHRATIGLTTTFVPRDVRVARGGRRIVLESFDGRRWRRFARIPTKGSGVAVWTGRLGLGTYRLRARYAGSAYVGAAASPTLTLSVG